MSTDILSDETKAKIPPLYSQDKSSDPMIYARLFSPGSEWQCLILEGCAIKDSFTIFGLFLGNGHRRGQISIETLVAMIAREGASVCADPDFQPIRLSALIKAQGFSPDLARAFSKEKSAMPTAPTADLGVPTDKDPRERIKLRLERIKTLASVRPAWKEGTLPPFGFALAQEYVTKDEQRKIEADRQEIVQAVQEALSLLASI